MRAGAKLDAASTPRKTVDAAAARVGPREAPAWIWWLAIFAITAGIYWPVLGGGFIWNDVDYVTAPSLRSVAGLGRIWCEIGATEQYYPLLHSAFWLQQRMWGDAAAGYHATNVVLHVLACGLFGLVLRRLGVRGAWGAALLFAVHPVAVESVAWISEQKNTLSTCLYLLAALAFLAFQRRPTALRYAGATALFCGALLAKSFTATLPAALLVARWWKHGKLDWRADIKPLLPWFLIGAGFGLFTAWVERVHVGAHGDDFQLSFAQQLLLAPRIAWFYLGKLVWPAELVFIYPRWQVDVQAWGQYLFLFAAMAAIANAWIVRARTRAPLAALLFFGGSLFPVLGFLPVYGFVFSYVADHWQYLPCLGVLAFVAAAFSQGLAGAVGVRCSRWLRAAGVVVLLGLALQSRALVMPYRDVIAFYENILRHNPAAWMAHNNLGLEWLRRGEITSAREHFAKAVALRPGYFDARNNLALALDAAGLPAEALEQFRHAMELNPGYAVAHANYGSALYARGNRDESRAQFLAALRLDPRLPKVAYNLAVIAIEQENWAEAVRYAEAALQQDPQSGDAWFALADAQRNAGRRAEAIAAYERAAAYAPSAALFNNLGTALLEAGRPADALASFARAVQLAPESIPANLNLARAYQKLGHAAEAADQAQRAQQLIERAAKAGGAGARP
jgi:tetratricopeptide (TPR) repeat protein